jgi:outer membrane lipoprotein
MNHFSPPIRILLPLLAALWLAGCASTLPQAIREAPPGAPLLDEVRADPPRFQGSPVRWGGVIASVSNRAEDTLIEVVSRPLERSGRPRETDASQGRFLARVAGFLDPAVYQAGRELTVSGRVTGLEARLVGGHEYPYVRVEVELYHLWPIREPAREPYYPPWWYDPWYPYHPFFGPWGRY